MIGKEIDCCRELLISFLALDRTKKLCKALRETNVLNSYRLAKKRGDFLPFESCNAAVQGLLPQGVLRRFDSEITSRLSL